MFKASYNRAVLQLQITTVTPLSIRAGDVGLDPNNTDLVCIRTNHAQHGRTVFIPGSSLRGVVRSIVESQLRGSLGESAACDPGNHKEGCGRHRAKPEDKDGAGVHKANCLACRLFGSTTLKGRCSIRDHFPFPATGQLSEAQQKNLEQANRTEVRPGIMIGRIEGSVKGGALFEQEMVPAGVTFWGDIALENYQAWQLGLLLSTIQELDEGFAQLGSGKSKGLGVVRAKVLSVLHEQKAGLRHPLGVGRLVPKEEATRYDLKPEAEFPKIEGKPHGLMERFWVPSDNLGAWQEAALKGLSLLQGGTR